MASLLKIKSNFNLQSQKKLQKRFFFALCFLLTKKNLTLHSEKLAIIKNIEKVSITHGTTSIFKEKNSSGR